MRLWITASFLLAGASFTVLQTLLVREMLISFSGNELSIGLVLGAWFLLEALGSGLAARLSRRLAPRPAGYAGFQVALALLLLPCYLLAGRMRALVGAVPGEAIGPLAALLGALLVLAPLGLVAGAMFTAGCRALEGIAAAGTVPAGRVYVLEAAGSIVGGIACTYLLIPFLSATQAFLLPAALNLAAAAILLLASTPRRALGGLAAGLLAGAALAGTLPPLGPALHGQIAAGRWAPAQVLYEANSDYGNIAATAVQGQVTVFANGTPVLTAPDPDAAAVEQLAHLPALFLEELPRRVLVIGGGAGGVLAELERYPLERLDYAEPDPLLIHAVQQAPTALTAAELADPRLQIALQDGRQFVRACRDCAGRYDLILLRLPPPATLSMNRLYTREFLELARPLLAPRGLLVFSSPAARTYLSPAARDLLACHERTLQAVFPHVRAIPADEQTLWLASAALPLDLGGAELAGRWESRGLSARALSADYLRYLLDEAVADAFAAGLHEGPAVAENRDVAPAGLRYALAYESARLAPELEPFYRALGRVHGWHLALGIGGLALAGLALFRRKRAVLPLAVATTGLAGMAANLLVLLAYQVLYGQLYRQVGLLAAAFMAGLALGGLVATRWAGRLRRPWRALAALELALAAGAAALAGGLALLLAGSAAASFLEHGLLLGMNLLAGALVGLEFPLANRIVAGEGPAGSRAAGALYAADLAGATVGAVVLAAVLLPALGLVETALLVALLKGGSLLLVGTASWREGTAG